MRSGPLRSSASSAITCRQPLPSSPTSASCGSSTLSNSTSQKCASPAMSRMGRISMPGRARSKIICDSPRWRSSGAPEVRTSAHM
ncbi:Uncharacterised protein [Bordetella pertussis]|nr:Uncharacterised protein [Bordetella pertussis]